ncbi:MAG TPA: hypothetical protein VI032_17795 [Burkholderiaceae bacterium]
MGDRRHPLQPTQALRVVELHQPAQHRAPALGSLRGREALEPARREPAVRMDREQPARAPAKLEVLTQRRLAVKPGLVEQRRQLVGRVHPRVLGHACIGRVGRGAEGVELLGPDRRARHGVHRAPGDDADGAAVAQHAVHLAQRGDRIGQVEEHVGQQCHVERR